MKCDMNDIKYLCDVLDPIKHNKQLEIAIDFREDK